MQAIKQFKKETGLSIVEKNNELLFSTKDIHEKLFSNQRGRTKYQDWIVRYVFNVVDEGNNQVYKWTAKKYKTKGRPGTDYLVSKRDAKKIILKSNTIVGEYLLDKLIDFEENYNSNIKTRLGGKAGRRSLTDSITRNKEEPKHYHYSNETNMIYKVLFGHNAKQLKEIRKIDEKDDLRDDFTEKELEYLDIAEIIISTLIEFGYSYEERKEKLEQWVMKKSLLEDK